MQYKYKLLPGGWGVVVRGSFHEHRCFLGRTNTRSHKQNRIAYPLMQCSLDRSDDAYERARSNNNGTTIRSGLVRWWRARSTLVVGDVRWWFAALIVQFITVALLYALHRQQYCREIWKMQIPASNRSTSKRNAKSTHIRTRKHITIARKYKIRVHTRITQSRREIAARLARNVSMIFYLEFFVCV